MMTLSVFLICAAMIQLSSAQVFSYVQRNSIAPAVETTARYISNVANALQNPSNALTVSRVPTGMAVPSNVANANPLSATTANLATANIANAANQNLVSSYVAGQNLANANYAANYANAASQSAANAIAANYANVASETASSLASAANFANQNLAAANAVPVAVTNAASVVNANLNNAALANAALASINGNVATFNLGNNGNTFTVTSGSPDAPGFGLSIIADALEVGGTVAVNGQIPIFGSVGVNGNVPTDGAATVSYNCGGKQVVDIV